MTAVWVMPNYKREVTCRAKTSAFSKLYCKTTNDTFHVACYLVARSGMNITSRQFSFMLGSDMGRGTLTVPCLFMVFSVSSGKFLGGSLIILQSFLSIDFHISLLIISRCVVWHILKLVLEKDGNQLDRSYEKWKEYCKESRRKGTFCIQKKEGRLTGLVTCWVRCHLKKRYSRKDTRRTS